MLHLGLHVVERLTDLVHAPRPIPTQVGHAAPDDGERRSQLMARVGGELALATQRLADRHQGASGVQESERAGGDEHGEPASHQHDKQGSEGVPLDRAVLEDLDDVWLARSSRAMGFRVGVYPTRCIGGA